MIACSLTDSAHPIAAPLHVALSRHSATIAATIARERSASHCPQTAALNQTGKQSAQTHAVADAIVTPTTGLNHLRTSNEVAAKAIKFGILIKTTARSESCRQSKAFRTA